MGLRNLDAIILNLDDTLLIEKASALQAFRSSAELAARYHKIAVDAFIEKARACARELWYSFPTFEYAKRIGISSWEALWARFEGRGPQIGELRTLRDFYRVQTWLNTLDHFGISDRRLARKCAKEFFRTRRRLHILFDDALPFLHAVRNKYKLALITNGIPELQYFKLKKSGLLKFFDFITVSGDIGSAKPDKRVFDYTLMRLGTEARHALMIGNSFNSDINGAQRAGIRNVWLKRSKEENLSKTGATPDYQVDSLEHVIRLLENR